MLSYFRKMYNLYNTLFVLLICFQCMYAIAGFKFFTFSLSTVILYTIIMLGADYFLLVNCSFYRRIYWILESHSDCDVKYGSFKDFGLKFREYLSTNSAYYTGYKWGVFIEGNRLLVVRSVFEKCKVDGLYARICRMVKEYGTKE